MLPQSETTSMEQDPQVTIPTARKAPPLTLVRILIAANLLAGFYYLSWRYAYSINWATWPIALLLIAAETYSYVDSWLFGLTMWRIKQRGAVAPPPEGATVDVFITCYNEPVELVRETAIAARDIRWPHTTSILDDGNSPTMRAMAEEIGVGYIVRSQSWQGKARHAKAGNLNNALFQTSGEFLLILDADQIPRPHILDDTLGYFRDPKVAFVQTPQWFYNVPPGDPFGSQAPLFYGPIQQGKDGWNAAFFCGSNAVLRREALMYIGIKRYVYELTQRVERALSTAEALLDDAERTLRAQLSGLDAAPPTRSIGRRLSSWVKRDGTAQNYSDYRIDALHAVRDIVHDARRSLRAGHPIQEVTWEFQRRAELIGQLIVNEDMAAIRAELADIPGIDLADIEGSFGEVLDDQDALAALVGREASPLAAIETVRNLLLAVDVDRDDEAQPVMPLSTISVTEDMATAMRLHASGWKSVYHDDVLAIGLAPEDLRTSLQQRLRWAQGTIQVLLRENPLVVRGLTLGQRLMYFATMYSYMSGFFTIVYLVAPLLFLFFGILPVHALSLDFFMHLVPYLLINQALFIVIGWGRPTWRGQQYSMALFPLWIHAVISAVGNVVFGQKLGFVVTPKTRAGGAQFRANLQLVRPQLIAIVLLSIAALYGLTRVVLGLASDPLAVLINIAWVGYDLAALGVVLKAAAYKPSDDAEAGGQAMENSTAGEKRGRAGAGTA